MNKCIKKKHQLNVEVINTLAKKYSFSAKYIKMIVLGERTPVFQDRIVSEYREMNKKINDILKDDTLLQCQSTKTKA